MNPALIVHVVHHFDTGGMENGMVNLFNALDPQRFRHAVICLTNYSDFRQRISAQRVDFYALNKTPGHDFSWAPRLWRLLRQLRPALVHTRNLSALEAQFVAAAAGIRSTVHGEHGRDMFDLHGRSRKYILLRRVVQPLVSHYVAVSRDLADWLRVSVHVPERKIHQIYNGVDCVKFFPRPVQGDNAPRPDVLPPGFAQADSVVFGSVGRMAEVKDYPTLTRAFIRLLRQNPQARQHARLVIVGEGVARQSCLGLLAEAGVADRAWLPGERHDIAALLQAFDVFVLPSLNEGISNTLLEAQASALPVIATRVGGNIELVEEAVQGTLVPPGDAEAMAQALLRYVGAPALISQQGTRARQRVMQHFSIPAMAEAYAQVYEQAMAGTRFRRVETPPTGPQSQHPPG